MTYCVRIGAYLALACLATACGGGGNSKPVVSNEPPELLLCRARVDSPLRFAEVALRTSRNLGSSRVSDRTGREMGARLHPDGIRVVFAREKVNGSPDSRELYVSTIDGSSSELRLTQNTAAEDDPVWSPDGSKVLFTSSRDGEVGLWVSADNGSNPERFLPTPTGYQDGQADWHAATDRVAFRRRDPDGHCTLWLSSGSGLGEIPLTDGGVTTGPDLGDHQPSFSPDGTTLAFVRQTSPSRASLCLCEVATGFVTVQLAPSGTVTYPRFSPSGNRCWFGLAEPDLGRQTARLAYQPTAGGPATLVWPDERWQLFGIDFLPTPPIEAEGTTPVRLDIRDATLQVAAASDAFGSLSQLREDDGNEFYLRTTESSSRQIAGINCRLDLPIEEPRDMHAVRVTAIARVSRINEDSVLRMSLRNLSDNRYDTVVELTPSGTSDQTMTFRTSSLRHITSEKTLQFTVIADLADGSRADFWIDMVEVELIPLAGF
jgi:hypothetical protein